MKTNHSIFRHARYTIKKAEPHHIPLLNDIELAAGTIFPENFLPEHILLEKLPIDILQSAKDEGLLWVAVDVKDCPVGYALLQIRGALALLAQVDVHPNHGQQGLGSALIIHSIQQVYDYGFAELYLTTFSDVRWNAPFYKKLGFSILKNIELPPVISNILDEEYERGLNNRVAMRLKISQKTQRTYWTYYKSHADKNIKKNTLEKLKKISMNKGELEPGIEDLEKTCHELISKVLLACESELIKGSDNEEALPSAAMTVRDSILTFLALVNPK